MSASTDRYSLRIPFEQKNVHQNWSTRFGYTQKPRFFGGQRVTAGIRNSANWSILTVLSGYEDILAYQVSTWEGWPRNDT